MRKRTEIVVKTARIQGLDPEKPYLIRLDESFRTEEADLLRDTLKSWGLKKIIVSIGDVKISEIKDGSPKH